MKALEQMINQQLKARGIKSKRVLEAMRQVPREEFVTSTLKSKAYSDQPLPIGEGQTISQPYIVALMSELAEITPRDRVLEIGSGCGYQTAILSYLAQEVYTIELIPSLARQAQTHWESLGYKNITLRQSDGFHGWPEKSPFDAILVTAAPAQVPEALKDQLKQGGRLMIPVGEDKQMLLRLTHTKDGWKTEPISPVRFVPMRKLDQKEARD